MITLSNTRVGNFQRCAQRYVWSYLDKVEVDKTAGLRRGEALHAALESFYRGELAGTLLSTRIDQALTAAWNNFEPTGEDMLEDWELMQRILLRYFREVALQDQWVVREVELTWNTPTDYPFSLTGRIDLMVQAGGRNFIVDHKFNKQVSDRHLPVDPQVSTYLLLARILGIEVHGVIYNIIRMTEGGVAVKEPVVRQTVRRTSAWLDRWEQQLMSLSQQIEEFHANPGAAWQLRNFGANCHWDCSFYEHCMATMNSPEEEGPNAKEEA